MDRNWRVTLVKCRHNPIFIPLLLGLLRIASCLLPQTGYLHPDEFLQSTDIIAGHHFNSKIEPAWEFTTEHPIRCMLFPYVINTIAFKLVQLLSEEPSAYLLIILPRLMFTLLSFVVDFCLYRLCCYHSPRGLWYLPLSVIMQSSFACLTLFTRTLSNTIETILFSIALVLVCRTFRNNSRTTGSARTRPIDKQDETLDYKNTLSLGIVISLGLFNRPTFPAFILVPLLFWLHEELLKTSFNYTKVIKRSIIPLVTSAGLTAFFMSLFDTIYYRSNEFIVIMNALAKFDLDNLSHQLTDIWVITPYNFISYNTDLQNLSKYGIHLPFTHMLVNIPLLFNVLAYLFYCKLSLMLVGLGNYRPTISPNKTQTMMVLNILTSTVLISFIPHQEFRFLLPLIVPFVYTFAFNVYAKNSYLIAWVIINFTLTFFYSNIHQAGVIKSVMDMDIILKHELKSPINHKIDIIAARCYQVPLHLWNVPQNSTLVDYHTNGCFDDFETNIKSEFARITSVEKPSHQFKHDCYVMLPSVYLDSLVSIASNLSYVKKINEIKRYGLHFTGEDLNLCLTTIYKMGFKKWGESFGFSLVNVDISPD